MIAANTGFLWGHLPFPERIARTGRAGFDAVEFHDEAQAEGRGHDLADVRAALREAGLPLLGLNARMGESVGCAGVPGREAEARADIEAAIDAARALGGTAVHVLAGVVEESEEAWATYRANLAHACERAAGLSVLIEPLCAAAMPGYLLGSVARAASVVAWVGHDRLRIMLDAYHAHQADGDAVRAYRDHAALIGHVQVADPDTRAEPSPALVRSFRAAGWQGAMGAEYVQTDPDEERVAWLDALTREERGARP